jgi:hypothetical protein
MLADVCPQAAQHGGRELVLPNGNEQGRKCVSTSNVVGQAYVASDKFLKALDDLLRIDCGAILMMEEVEI